MDGPIMLEVFTNIAITGLTFFCVAWFFSSILTSPTISIVAGLITPLIIWSIILYIALSYPRRSMGSANMEDNGIFLSRPMPYAIPALFRTRHLALPAAGRTVSASC